MGSEEATGELLCIPPGVRRLVGPILLVIVREESTTSVEPEGLLLERTARLEDDPPRVAYEDVCIRSGSARPARACTIASIAKNNSLSNARFYHVARKR